jgi:hypothetical protein
MEPEKGLELSDAPGFTIPVFSRRAWECLEPLISKNVEILPLDFNEKEYFGINVITVLQNMIIMIRKKFIIQKKKLRFY